MKSDCREILENLTGKQNILFVKRGNVAIRMALKFARKLGHDKALLQDQGGWLTFKQFGDKEKLEIIELKTDYGIFSPEALDNYSDCVLLINSLPGYFALQEMEEVAKICKEKNILLINDITGSIGTKQAFFGDIVLGSFGSAKPVNLGNGGFIATDNKEFLSFFEEKNPDYEIDFNYLLEKLNGLDKHLEIYKQVREKVLSDLKDYDIIHKDKYGINVIVKFRSEQEKEKLINYCDKENLEYTLCPREIRVMENAVSIEVKRL
ncbi:MAG: DegT/DnrJ/EryC1/StrS family aminotransferase [Nanoarchaeota archaeon]|nr:DegT/DnrJ/EryC1/StrS family aminotransferase [Nanoarchaeota archaeon]MBU1322041.1 DegT/DnrJ/EryC1/StrS family aminotransferase [Nanoarchaeota archaeon]MBU1597233.1 DegT/DnrJ/EryC1/StrS family aminotransferase [Nanoarchaeota archaeon]MBU2440722.1 DegT/DnrJ/EryC1/StrS family aminotransferase [Nanoarchaeota archaeon]